MEAFPLPDCPQCTLRTPSFFCHFDGSVAAQWAGLSHASFQPLGTRFFLQGEPADGVFLVCRGTVKLWATHDGFTFLSRVAHAGEILGVREALTQSTYRYTAEALEPCDVRQMAATDFMDFLHEHPDLCGRAVQQLSTECDFADRLRALALEDNMTFRMGRFVLAMADDHGKTTPAGIRVRIQLTQRELAQVIGVSRETVTRKLSELRRAGLIIVRGSAITIPDREKLEAFCHAR